MSICVKLSDNGFFTNFNQVVDWLAFGDACDLSVGVDWSETGARRNPDFSYGTQEEGNLWNSFFAPLPCASGPDLVVDRMWTQALSGFRAYAFYNHAALRESARQRLHRSFERHVRLASEIEARIKSFALQHFAGRRVIGVHLRNPVGSVGIYSSIPRLDAYCRTVDRVLAGLPSGADWRIFAASDRDGLIQELAERYPGRVLSQAGVARAAKGSGAQVHMSAAAPRRALGVDVISDCWLLAQCAHLVGAPSAVCTAALFINPALAFSNAQSAATIAAGAVELELKTLYCRIFEKVHPQTVQALALAAAKGPPA